MNKLPLPGTIWLASDIHLGGHIPETRQAFYEFLARARQEADTLILAGDIFDFWAGDDIALKSPEPWLQEALQHLAQTAAHIPLYLMHGNRDFLLGKKIARHLGATLLEDTVILATDAGLVRLSHGDEYCTDDLAFQRFRKIVHNPFIQAVFLALPRKLRQSIANCARRKSQASHQYKNDSIMDVSAGTIENIFRQDRDIHTLVHGHTHKPAHHEIMLDGKRCHRWVLPDWEFDHGPNRAGYIEIKKSGTFLHRHEGTLNTSILKNN
ncbi:MAG: UDP-2,3-diacylglucosamine diphosphatase [Alcaligenaceae bacterium]|nr:UDP-2,3-diacylglucosamine diphosphatase [Alcaligenaceae bacterium]